MTRNKRSRKKKWIMMKEFTKREFGAFLIWVAIFAGTSTFFMIVKESWNLPLATLRWLAFAIAVMKLPKVFSKLHQDDVPHLVKFAKAFREGFLSVQSIAPDLSQWLTKARELLRNIKNGG